MTTGRRAPGLEELSPADRRAQVRSQRRKRLALEYPGLLDFEDSRLEGRRLIAECFGTSLLVLAGAGAPVVAAVSHGQVSRAAAVAAPGLMVMALILSMGAVSGAHLNPAVTLAFSIRRDFPWRRAPGYLLAQLIGAVLACGFLRAVFGRVGHLGATTPGAGLHDWQAFLIELVLTLGLVSTILGTASRAQNVGAASAIAVGSYIVLAGLWASPISGASMNPVRSLGPDLVLGRFGHLWVYLAGPLGGATLAALAAWLLHGPGDLAEREAARGTLGEERPPAGG